MENLENNQFKSTESKLKKEHANPNYPIDMKLLTSSPITIQKLIRNINIHRQFISPNRSISWVTNTPTMETLVKRVQDKYMKDKVGDIHELETKIDLVSTIQKIQGTFINKTPIKQTFLTQQYEETWTNAATFSSGTKEKQGFEATFKPPWDDIVGGKYSITISQENKSGGATTTKETQLFWRQTINVEPNSQKETKLVLKKGISFNKGMISYEVNLNDTIGGTYFWSGGEWGANDFTIKEILEFLHYMGYGKLIRNTTKRFSVIKTDNPLNPTWATLNVPFDWQSQTETMSELSEM